MSEDKYRMIDEYKSGHKNTKYQRTFDCISDFEPLYGEERYLKDIDTNLKELESAMVKIAISPIIRIQHDA